MATSPTQRSLQYARTKLGWHAAVVEKWIPQTKRRIDLFGIIDIVAISPTTTIGIQATSTSNTSSRVDKILNEEQTYLWLLDPSRHLEVWGWAKRGAVGKRKLWTLQRIDIRDRIDPSRLVEHPQVTAQVVSNVS